MAEFVPNQWLMECGCKIDADWAGYGVSTDLTLHHNWRIKYCSKHGAANELYEALKDALYALHYMETHGIEDWIDWGKRLINARKAIGKADGE